MTPQRHPDFDDHELIIFCRDAERDLKAITAIHNTVLGPGMGGCRSRIYKDEEEALSDVLRLSRGITYKYAAAGIPHGGAKAVILREKGDRSDEAVAAFADFVERLAGLYVTAEDAGVDTNHVCLRAQRTRFVRNLPIDNDEEGGHCTAYGVFQAILAACDHFGGLDLSGLTVGVEGLGKVGGALCKILHQHGAALVVSDPAVERIEAAVKQYNAKSAAVGTLHTEHLDVYAPCAFGGTLNEATIPVLNARVIAGAANNQWASSSDGDRFYSRGILYCPDFVVNAGAVLAVAPAGETYTRDKALQRVSTIRSNLSRILQAAETERLPPYRVAERLALERLRHAGGAIGEQRGAISVSFAT